MTQTTKKIARNNNSYDVAIKESLKIINKIEKLDVKKKKFFNEEANLYKDFIKIVQFISSENKKFKSLKRLSVEIEKSYKNQLLRIKKILR